MRDPVFSLADLLADALHGAAHQVLGTFLAPGSTFSVGALALSLVVTTIVIVPIGRERRVSCATLRRALFPRRMWRSASGRTDLAFFVLGILFAGAAVGWAVMSAEAVRLWGVAGVASVGIVPRPTSLPAPVAAVIATAALFLAYEFAYWLDHWAKHRFAVLWPFHRVHHQAESLSLFTNGRVHPVDTIIFHNIVAAVTGVAGAVLELVLGSDAMPLTFGGTNALIMLSSVVLTHLQHSHLPLGYGSRWGRWLLGPAHHQIHHSADPAHFNTNLGNSLTLFDRLFGTFHEPTRRPAGLRFGVNDGEPAPHSSRAGLVQPFVDAGATTGRALAGLVPFTRGAVPEELARVPAATPERAPSRASY